MNFVYENISKWRLEHNLSVYAIEIGSGLSKGTIKSWKDSMPSWDKVLRVANFLDLSVDYLVGNTQNPKSHKNNPVDCATAMQKLIRVINKYSKDSDQANIRLESDIEGILKQYNIDINI